MKFFVLLFFAITLLWADRSGGPYIGLGYAHSQLKEKGFFDLEDDGDSSLLFVAGAYINPYLSVEIEYTDLLSFKRNNGENVEAKILDVNTQAHYAFFENRLDFFAKFGVGEIYKTQKGFTFVYGGGAAYRLNDRYALRIGYNYFDFGYDENGDNSSDIDMGINQFYGVFEVQF